MKVINRLEQELTTTKEKIRQLQIQIDQFTSGDYYDVSTMGAAHKEKRRLVDKTIVLTQRILHRKEIKEKLNLRVYDTVAQYKKKRVASEQYWLKRSDSSGWCGCQLRYKESGYSMEVNDATVEARYENEDWGWTKLQLKMSTSEFKNLQLLINRAARAFLFDLGEKYNDEQLASFFSKMLRPCLDEKILKKDGKVRISSGWKSSESTVMLANMDKQEDRRLGSYLSNDNEIAPLSEMVSPFDLNVLVSLSVRDVLLPEGIVNLHPVTCGRIGPQPGGDRSRLYRTAVPVATGVVRDRLSGSTSQTNKKQKR